MRKLRDLGLITASAMFLPGVLFAYLSLGLVQLNLEELRSLPNTYLWVVKSFTTIWLICAALFLAALRNWFQWPARLLVVSGILVFLFDTGRGLWLSTWPQVAVAGLIESIAVFAFVFVIWRIEIRRLLEYSAVFALVLIAVTVSIHIKSVGPHLIWNIGKEIVRPTVQAVADHPNPWQQLPPNAHKIDHAPGINMIEPSSDHVNISEGKTVLISNTSPPGTVVATLALSPTFAASNGIVEVQLKLSGSDIAVGLRDTSTDRWFYRQEAKYQDGERQTLYLPFFSSIHELELAFANGRFGTESVAFEVEQTTFYGLDPDPAPKLSERTGNVYHILLDEFDLPTYKKVTAEKPDLLYDEFTLYEEFRTSQPSTAWSLPTIFSGSYFETSNGLSADVWREQTYQAGFPSVLEDAGVPTYMYTLFTQHCPEESTYCLSSQDYRHELISQISDNMIIDLTFLRTLPNSLRAVLIDSVGREEMAANSWDYGYSITSRIGQSKVQTSEDHILKDFYYSLNLFTIEFFKRMLVEEVQRPESGQYVFFHTMVPHGPYARDVECRFIPREERTPDNREIRAGDQAECALRVVGWLVQHLKRLNRYDDALIIVHADHGRPHAPPGTEGFRLDHLGSDEWPDWIIDSLSSSLLMVKWPYATKSGSWQTPAQSVDLAPTVLHHFGIGLPANYLGTPLQIMPEKLDRPTVFYAMVNPTVGSSVKYLSKYTRNEDDGTWTFVNRIATDP